MKTYIPTEMYTRMLQQYYSCSQKIEITQLSVSNQQAGVDKMHFKRKIKYLKIHHRMNR